MSINTSQTVRCPKCGQCHDITVWNSITVKDSPDLKADLLGGRVNMFLCPSCGMKALMPEPLLYHDEEKRLLYSFMPCADKEESRKLFEEMRQSSQESGELQNYEGYILRFITDYNALLEKIITADAGLSDKVTEMIKLMILMNEPDKADNRKCMFGKLAGDELEFMVQDFKENQIYTSRVPLTTYNLLRDEIKRSGAKIDYSFDWEVVDTEYASSLLGQ